ncbi:hypothetical protein BDQ17DRAFT_1512198 [Cyathus striatus]|nr:hypothetical protein BDQ17DRAFT_1512198 [Cyathus striatus]
MEHEIDEMSIAKPWPKPNEMSDLIEMCSGLFIAATTAMKFISAGSGVGAQVKLRLILENQYVKSNNMNAYGSLDHMYMKILLLASQSLHWKEDIFKSIVAIIILGFNSLTIQGIMQILRLNHSENDICEILYNLKAVLLVPPFNSNLPIHAFHLSFHDFLTNSERCSDTRFYIDTKQHHTLIATFILKVNVCNIEDMSTANKDISIPDTMTDGVGYAATYWIFHLQEGLINENLSQLVTTFILKYLLQWLEVISLYSQLQRALECIRLLKNLPIIKDHALQIYESALLFTPQETLLYKTYQDQLKSVKVVQGYNKYWDPCVQVLEGHSCWVRSVAISQDGATIVSDSADMTVRVWNSHSGKLLNELKGHSDKVRSVAISQDGATIVSGSDDRTVRVWNSYSGKLLNELKGHSHWVRSVAISQDGATIVSGSHDNTV